ncbi:hypothetical protein GGR56DRAFT_677028 [Xylariaceae sp. FL0804]|nr:hypothetical protein GGR56DRAFT_677028 [Xylariaceae sp. FL0804]
MSQMTLYRQGGSSSIAAEALLNYLKVPFTPITMAPDADKELAPADGSLTRQQYRATVHRDGYVPAMVIPSSSSPDSTSKPVVITETNAILTYIAALASEELEIPAARGLLGRSPLEQGQVAEWQAWLADYVQTTGFGSYLRPRRFVDREDAYPALKAHGERVIRDGFAVVEEKLGAKAGAGWVVGDGVTVVDFNLYRFWHWGSAVEADMRGTYPAFARWMAKFEGLVDMAGLVKESGWKLQAEY